MNNCIALGVDVKWYFLAYQEQEMKKFTFFHPVSGSKSEGNGDKTAKHVQPQVPAGSPERKSRG